MATDQAAAEEATLWLWRWPALLRRLTLPGCVAAAREGVCGEDVGGRGRFFGWVCAQWHGGLLHKEQPKLQF